MVASSQLIFYDQKKKRKFYFRFITISLIVIFLLITMYMAVSIATVSSKDLQSKTKDYYNYYYTSPTNTKKIALTFDDGPHPDTTREIMAILKKYQVPATFFFLGKNVLTNRQIAREAQEAGFEIGNHSFTHSLNIHNSERRLRWELNATNKLIEDITGKPTVLYRPPYLLNIGIDPTLNPDIEVELPLAWAAKIGYIPVGADIDSKDWQVDSPEEILANINKYVAHGHFILLHDGGDVNAKYTIPTLPTIIENLKQQGYEFATVSQILGVKKEDLTPAVIESSPTYQNYLEKSYLKFILLFKPATSAAISVLITIILILVILRVFFVLLLFALSPNKKVTSGPKWYSSVSVLVPAYNEEENIASTLRSVLKSDHPIREVIVIDDGSTDNTVQVVRRVQRKYEKKIRLIQIPNGGKANALNIGLDLARSKVIIALDADTIFTKNTVSHLVKHFINKKVGAVAGKVCVVRPLSILGAFQGIEYTIGQNIEKKSFSNINAVGIIPGPVGAWRKSEVRACGGYSNNTLVEDQDLTLAILKRGKKVIYEPEAIVYTETPHTVKSFIKQRFRWIFGTMQCFWKYKSELFRNKHPSMGWIILPNIILYNTLVPLFSPVIDIIAIMAIFSGNWIEVAVAYGLFTLFDLIYAYIGFWGEKKNRYLLLIVPFQRLYYRQILYFVIIKGIIKAIEGTAAFWHKVEKTGQAQEFYLKTIRRTT